jgi:hypothetical protein
MTEDDLTKAQELFRTRRFVFASLEAAQLGAKKGIKGARLDVDFCTVQTFSDGKPNQYGYATFDKEDRVAMRKFAVGLLTERLKDIDASLRAFGCEPPKGTDVEMPKLGKLK